MTATERSPLRRALHACRDALGLRQGRDPVQDVEEAADEVRIRLAHLRQEAASARQYPQPRRPRLPTN